MDQLCVLGKTSLTNRFIRGQFDSQTRATVGATHLSKKLAINGIIVKLNLVRGRFLETETTLAFSTLLSSSCTFSR